MVGYFLRNNIPWISGIGVLLISLITLFIQNKTIKKEVMGLGKMIKLIISRKGVIVNPEDGTRNISFKVETLNSLLEDLSENINNEEKKEVIYRIGSERGKNFANDLFKEDVNNNKTRNKKIKKWCKFDSAVGFGKFKNSLSLNKKGEIGGVLKIHECFISYYNPSSYHHPNYILCYFIKGYCAGVMEVILEGRPVEVECKSKKDGKCPKETGMDPKKHVCKFSFKYKQEKPGETS